MMDIDSRGKYDVSDISEVGPADGLVAWYPLQGDTKDYANSNDGTNNGAVATARGYSFDGSSWIEETDVVKDIGPFTAAVWAKRTGSISSDWSYIVHRKASAVTIGGAAYTILTSNVGDFRCSINGTSYLIPGITPIVDRWYHLCLTYDGTTGKLFIDNNMTVQSTFAQPTTEQGIAIGGRPNYRMWNGNISDVRIYNRALSAEEVSILYEITNPELNNRMKQSKDCVYIRGEFQEA